VLRNYGLLQVEEYSRRGAKLGAKSSFLSEMRQFACSADAAEVTGAGSSHATRIVPFHRSRRQDRTSRTKKASVVTVPELVTALARPACSLVKV